MATKYMVMSYLPVTQTENPDGTFTTSGNPPNYTTLLPLTLNGILAGNGAGGGVLRDATGTFNYGTEMQQDMFLYDDANEAAIIACYGPTGYATYQAFDVAYNGSVGTEPTRNH